MRRRGKRRIFRGSGGAVPTAGCSLGLGELWAPSPWENQSLVWCGVVQEPGAGGGRMKL